MSIATELQNYADGLDDAYDAVNDMSGIIPQHKNMNNLDQAIRTIPQNTGTTYTAGNGINIDANNEISIDDTVVAELSDLPGVMTGATSGAAGASGLVPAPAAGDQDKYLKGDGTWGNVSGNGGVVYYLLRDTGHKFGIYSDSQHTTPVNSYTVWSGVMAGTPTTFVLDEDGLDSHFVKSAVLGDDEILVIDNFYYNSNDVATSSIWSVGWAFVYTNSNLIDVNAYSYQAKLTAGANISISGSTISATDTTYSDMVGATSLDAGAHGLVPAPSAGDESKVLSGAGTWVAQTAAQVNSDWNANSGVAQILNKPSLATVATSGLYSDLTGTPSLATVATSGDYDDLLNKPTIPTVNDATLTIQHNGTNVQTFSANQGTNATANIETIYADTITPTTAVATIGTTQIADAAVTSAKVAAPANNTWANFMTLESGYSAYYYGNGVYQLGKITIVNLVIKKESGYFPQSSQVMIATIKDGYRPTANINTYAGFGGEWDVSGAGYCYLSAPTGQMYVRTEGASDNFVRINIAYVAS